MNELLVGEIVHAVTDLSTEFEEEFRQIHREVWDSEKGGGGREGDRESNVRVIHTLIYTSKHRMLVDE